MSIDENEIERTSQTILWISMHFIWSVFETVYYYAVLAAQGLLWPVLPPYLLALYVAEDESGELNDGNDERAERHRSQVVEN